MRAPSRPELILALVALSAFGLWQWSTRSVAAKDAEIRIVDAERKEVQRENATLRSARVQDDRQAEDSIAGLHEIIQDAEELAAQVASAGRETYVEIIEAVPDTMPELRALIERRERMHTTEVAVLREVIDAERSAGDVLRGQLSQANGLLSGIESELVLAGEQIGLLEELRDDGLSNLEAMSIGVGGYFVATEVLGATMIEGLVVGGVTFIVSQGGSKLFRWIF